MVYLWLRLLLLAGKCNDDGHIYVTKKLPYTIEALSEKLGIGQELCKKTLKVFKELDMIKINKTSILIKGWLHHQNTVGLCEIREYNRLAKRRSRAKQRLEKSVIDMSRTSQECQGTDIDIEKDIDKEREKEMYKEKDASVKPSPSAPKKHRYGAYANVLLSDDEYNELRLRFPDSFSERIERFSEAVERKGYRYRSHYLAIIDWARREDGEPSPQCAAEDSFLGLLREL